jgi:flagellar hook-basal body complex protein FliE
MSEPINLPDINARRVSPAQLDPGQLRTGPAGRTPLEAGQSFTEVLNDSIGEVQRLQTQADDTIRQLVAGEIKDVTDAMVAVEKADVAFQTLMGVRNRIVTAYEEIMRMQV